MDGTWSPESVFLLPLVNRTSAMVASVTAISAPRAARRLGSRLLDAWLCVIAICDSPTLSPTPAPDRGSCEGANEAHPSPSADASAVWLALLSLSATRCLG